MAPNIVNEATNLSVRPEETKELLEECNHSVLDYLKKHPGIMATIVSALVAIVAFVLNATLYYKTCRYLLYWGYEPNNVIIANANQIYVLVIAFVYFITNTYLQQFLLDSYNYHNQFASAAHCLKQLHRDNVRRCRKCKRDYIGLKITFPFLKMYVKFFKRKTDPELISLLNKLMIQQGTDILSAESEEKKTKKLIHAMNIDCVKGLCPSLLLAFIIAFVFVSIFNTFSLSDGKYIIISNLLVSVLIILLPYMGLYLTRILPLHRKVKKAVKRSRDDVKEILDEIMQQEKPKHPLRSILTPKLSELFSNRNLFMTVLVMTFALLYVFFVFSYNTGSITKDQQTFSITTIDEQEYAIIYINGNNYYLDEVSIESETITINTDCHRVVRSDDIAYIVYTYDKVIKLPFESSN